VAFQVGDREAFIPAGATCATRKRGGPGIPYFEDTSDELRRGVERFERGDRGALGGILAAAGPHDGLTLWHLLTRVPEADRGAVFDRFRELVQLPAGVSRDSVVRSDPQAIDHRWNALIFRTRVVAWGNESGANSTLRTTPKGPAHSVQPPARHTKISCRWKTLATVPSRCDRKAMAV
jgi:hypothetical protein